MITINVKHTINIRFDLCSEILLSENNSHKFVLCLRKIYINTFANVNVFFFIHFLQAFASTAWTRLSLGSLIFGIKLFCILIQVINYFYDKFYVDPLNGFCVINLQTSRHPNFHIYYNISRMQLTLWQFA
jgi:hypothetical protein